MLVFPRVANTVKSVLLPMDRGEALLELAPNVLLTEARSSQAHLDALANSSPQVSVTASRQGVTLTPFLRCYEPWWSRAWYRQACR